MDEPVDEVMPMYQESSCGRKHWSLNNKLCYVNKKKQKKFVDYFW